MYNSDPIQQTNLVSDDAAAAMSDMQDPVSDQVVEPTVVQPQTDQSTDASSSFGSMPAMDSAPGDTTTAEPASEATSVQPEATTSPAPEATDTDSTTTASDDVYTELDGIKKSALDELQPLIEHVEQSPEERYETVMMMIRSNDDATLIAQAYEAAKGIEDEKTRATALLNIVSEIEYLKSKANS